VWACVGWNFKSSLVFDGLDENEPRNMTMELYVAKMLPIVKGYQDAAKAKSRGFIFQDDNDGGHGTRVRRILRVYTKIRSTLIF
jgi:hypothetical protein